MNAIRSGILALVILFGAQPNHPARAATASVDAESGGIAIGGSVSNSTIVNTVNKQDPAVLAAMVQAFAADIAATDEARAKAESHAADLAARLGFTSSAVAEFFRILGKENVPDEKIPAQLIEIATHFAQAQAELATLEPDDPKAAEFAKRAQEALTAGRLAEADGLLDQAKEIELAAYRQARELKEKAQEAEDRHALKAADVVSRKGSIALTQLRYREAAKRFAEAAGIVPLDGKYADQRILYVAKEASAYYQQGDEFGDNAALLSAIDRYRAILTFAPSDREDWAIAQNGLGNALRTLGDREGATTHLEEAVAAYRAALAVQTRERAPLNWAAGQNNLGAALDTLGERESGTARLEEAVAAYRAALEERTRERAPLDWAQTQNNLGIALQALGERESGTARLEEAVAAYRAALEELTRERVPLDWAQTQNNLGNALQALGGREGGTARLEEAVAAFRAALEEWTRERVPLDWATAQNNLGIALQALGGRESGTARLEEAVAAYRAALEERTRERAPLDWATTQHNLGNALQALGGRESGTARLEEAEAAYRAALEELTRERVPLNWAYTQHNLSNALAKLAERENSAERMEQALVCMRGAIEVYRQGGESYWLPRAQTRISEMETQLTGLKR